MFVNGNEYIPFVTKIANWEFNDISSYQVQYPFFWRAKTRGLIDFKIV